jgi:cholesterol oxidase
MPQNPPGLTFRETMSGPFALGVTDAQVGADEGGRFGSALSMHATINITDIDRFSQSLEHEGAIEGVIDFPPWGTGLIATHGVFKLFSPAEERGTKHMVYELGFDRKGCSYYFAGRKVVRDDRIFDLWSDTTTLYSTLHEGADRNGSVIGAGILSLGIVALKDLLSTVRVTNATSAIEKINAVQRFARFFATELVDSYLLRPKP